MEYLDDMEPELAQLVGRANNGEISLPDLYLRGHTVISSLEDHVQSVQHKLLQDAIVRQLQSPAGCTIARYVRLSEVAEGQTILFVLYKYNYIDAFRKLFDNSTWVRFMRDEGVLDASFDRQTLWATMVKEYEMEPTKATNFGGCLVRALVDMNKPSYLYTPLKSCKLLRAIFPASWEAEQVVINEDVPNAGSARGAEAAPQPAVATVEWILPPDCPVLPNGPEIFYTGPVTDGLLNPYDPVKWQDNSKMVELWKSGEFTTSQFVAGLGLYRQYPQRAVTKDCANRAADMPSVLAPSIKLIVDALKDHPALLRGTERNPPLLHAVVQAADPDLLAGLLNRRSFRADLGVNQKAIDVQWKEQTAVGLACKLERTPKQKQQHIFALLAVAGADLNLRNSSGHPTVQDVMEVFRPHRRQGQQLSDADAAAVPRELRVEGQSVRWQGVGPAHDWALCTLDNWKQSVYRSAQTTGQRQPQPPSSSSARGSAPHAGSGTYLHDPADWDVSNLLFGAAVMGITLLALAGMR